MKDDINAARRNLDQIMSEVRQLETSRGYNQALGAHHSCSCQNKTHAGQAISLFSNLGFVNVGGQILA